MFNFLETRLIFDFNRISYNPPVPTEKEIQTMEEEKAKDSLANLLKTPEVKYSKREIKKLENIFKVLNDSQKNKLMHITNTLPKQEKDKEKHNIAGMLIYTSVLQATDNKLIAALATAIAAGGKEFIDSQGYGHVEVGDFLATITPILQFEWKF